MDYSVDEMKGEIGSSYFRWVKIQKVVDFQLPEVNAAVVGAA